MAQTDTIEDLLERERAALRAADFKALTALAEEKERVVAELADNPIPDAPRLKRLRRMAERNAELLRAVERGVASAAATLDRARKPAEALSTYDKSGRVAKIGDVNGAITRRA